MATRSTVDQVKARLMTDYRAGTDLKPFIERASVIVSRVVTCATAKGITLTADELRLMETDLAAWFYNGSNGKMTSKSTGGASASWARGSGQDDEFLLAAKAIDYSGCLNQILSRNKARLVWLGKPPSEQTPIEDRS